MKRLSLLKAITIQFLSISLIVRLVFYFWSFSEIDFSITHFLRTLATGLFFDIGVISFFVLVYIIYLMLLSNKWVGSVFDKIFSYFYYFLTTLIFTFTFFAEFTFWEEFQNRFNFIAVDYLIYTYEVVQNINQSYPIPLLLTIIFSIVFLLFFILKKRKVFVDTFASPLKKQRGLLLIGLVLPLIYGFFIDNNHAEWSKNRYENEVSKAGIYSFFAAFRNNELSYIDFYKTQDIDVSFSVLKEKLKTSKEGLFSAKKHSIERIIKGDSLEQKPNVIFICIESLSADFLAHYGNTDGVTPILDSLLQHSINFENLYATGTRTIRGMEAITLSIPPSPGRSIVKRKNNRGLYNIGDVFKEKGYDRTFFYGGDGYFDNMNEFFGGNGFDIVDRGRGYLFGDSFTAKRTNIEDAEVVFENAWGVCDEDIYTKVIKEADKSHTAKKPFFDFIMTTSNHRPYTYPEGRIDISSGESRNGAVKYTDYAIGEFLKNAQQKPWFANTVFVIMADHCASSAGKWELNAAKYHIPALIYNLPNRGAQQVEVQCSQIDVFPTLFGYLGWTYTSHFYGKDITTFTAEGQRAFIGNYRKLGLLKQNKLTVLGDQKTANFYTWNKTTNVLIPQKVNEAELKEIISYYQTNDYLYKNGLMKRKK